MSAERIARIGDYVTTDHNATYEVVVDCFGVQFFNKILIRQGVLTGKKYPKYETEFSRVSVDLFEVQGEGGTYAVPNVIDLVVVPDKNLIPNTLAFVERIRKETFPTNLVALLTNAYKEGYRNGAEGYIGYDSESDMQTAQMQSWDSVSPELLSKLFDLVTK